MTSATLLEKCCLIAQPVAGNPTHYMIEQTFLQKGLDWRFLTFEVSPEQFGDAMRGIRALGFRGVKIAEPHHEAVIEFVDELTDLAQLCGSVDCITCDGDRLVGDCTEGAALVELVRELAPIEGRSAVLIGAGRLARAIATALAGAGVASITVANRTKETGQELVDLINNKTSATATYVPFSQGPLTLGADDALLVNASSLGSTDPSAMVPLDANSLHSDLIVADVAYSTSQTWLTRTASGRECRIIDGVQLYVQHTAIALQSWTGGEPDTAAMREAAEEFLGI